MKIKFVLIILIILFTSGCSLDPYRKPKYGEMAIDAWFNSEHLGETRKNIENISEIVSRECTFVENKANKYVFHCKITYKEKGETVIPLSKNSVMHVYAIFIKESLDKYDYKVYNSSYKDEIWTMDDYLEY